jgi:hypothetical protein
MVDAPAFKHAMTVQGAEFGIIVSPFVHRAHVASRGGLAEYAKVHVRVKEARRSAWMRLAGTAQLGQVQLAAQLGQVEFAGAWQVQPTSAGSQRCLRSCIAAPVPATLAPAAMSRNVLGTTGA